MGAWTEARSSAPLTSKGPSFLPIPEHPGGCIRIRFLSPSSLLLAIAAAATIAGDCAAQQGPGTNAVTIINPTAGVGGPQIPTIPGNAGFTVDGKFSTMADPNKGGVGIRVELFTIIDGQPAGNPVAGKFADTSTALGQNNANWSVNILALPPLAAGVYSLRATMKDTNGNKVATASKLVEVK